MDVGVDVGDGAADLGDVARDVLVDVVEGFEDFGGQRQIGELGGAGHRGTGPWSR